VVVIRMGVPLTFVDSCIRKKSSWELELKEGKCGDTYRAENDSAEGFDE
jgi:hypothetical protein